MRESVSGQRPVVIVDAANVIGSVPNGWWRDRAGAADSLIRSLDAAAGGGALDALFADESGAQTRTPLIEVVLEGAAKNAREASTEHVRIHRASRSGDDAIVDRVRAHRTAKLQPINLPTAEPATGPPRVLVITSDRELQRRVHELGARTMRSRAFRDVVEVTESRSPTVEISCDHTTRPPSAS